MEVEEAECLDMLQRAQKFVSQQDENEEVAKEEITEPPRQFFEDVEDLSDFWKQGKFKDLINQTGEEAWGGWMQPTARNFEVRSHDYLATKTKKPSAMSLFALANFELVSCDITHTTDYASHPRSWYATKAHTLPADTFYLIINIQVRSLCCSLVSYFALQTTGQYYSEEDLAKVKLQLEQKDAEVEEEDDDEKNEPKKNQQKEQWTYPKTGFKPLDDSLVWLRFLLGDEDFIRARFKMIPRLVSGPFYFRIPTRPAILGAKAPMQVTRGRNYLELDCNVDANMLAAQFVSVGYKISTQLVVDLMYVIEGQENHELPERCLGGCRLVQVDPSQAVKLEEEEEEDALFDDGSDMDDDALDTILASIRVGDDNESISLD